MKFKCIFTEKIDIHTCLYLNYVLKRGKIIQVYFLPFFVGCISQSKVKTGPRTLNLHCILYSGSIYSNILFQFLFRQVINFQIVFTGLAVLLVDKFGRKPLFAISALVQSIAIIVLGIFFKLDKDNLADDINWLPLVST